MLEPGLPGKKREGRMETGKEPFSGGAVQTPPALTLQMEQAARNVYIPSQMAGELSCPGHHRAHQVQSLPSPAWAN